MGAPITGHQSGHGTVGAGGGQLTHGLGPAVSGCENTVRSGAAVLACAQEAALIRKAQLAAEDFLGHLAHGFKKAADGQRLQPAVQMAHGQCFQSAVPAREGHDLGLQGKGHVFPLAEGIH